MLSLTNLLAIIGTAVGVGSLASAVWQYRRTVHRDIFRVYADKYNTVLRPEIYGEWQTALRGDSTKWEMLTPTMIAYLNLVWEEYYLADDHVIPFSLWKIWLPEIQQVLCSAFAKEVIRKYDFHFPEELTCG